MAELTLPVLLAVLQEMFGPVLFWAIVAGSLATTLAFLWLLIRDRGLRGAVLVRAELWAPVGGFGAVLFVQHLTNSSFADIGGPVDVVVLLGIAAIGAIGATLVAYVGAELRKGRKGE
ncbi:MAG: DUF5368 family protein [Rhodobacteraceae bacterium]|jgi:hypothetical protein|nr:DUF5368 family protein [Paracoccaceae bacterium]MBL4556913.1 DUF5368 family protein [Paracoccaceae bacterium]